MLLSGPCIPATLTTFVIYDRSWTRTFKLKPLKFTAIGRSLLPQHEIVLYAGIILTSITRESVWSIPDTPKTPIINTVELVRVLGPSNILTGITPPDNEWISRCACLPLPILVVPEMVYAFFLVLTLVSLCVFLRFVYILPRARKPISAERPSTHKTFSLAVFLGSGASLLEGGYHSHWTLARWPYEWGSYPSIGLGFHPVFSTVIRLQPGWYPQCQESGRSGAG